MGARWHSRLMTYRLNCARWLLLMTGLVFAVVSTQSVAAHAAVSNPPPSSVSMPTMAESAPCHQAPIKSHNDKKLDCCASDFACFSKCNPAVVAIAVSDGYRYVQRGETVFRPVAWTDVTPKPPTHPPSA